MGTSSNAARINNERGLILKQCKLLVWDEYTIPHKRPIEVPNRAIEDFKSNQCILGWMVLLLDDDFRQILPVITSDTTADEVN